MFSKKKLKNFLTPKKGKNGPQKLLIIGPDPFISQSSPDQRPTAQNWFFILRNLGTRHLFSYLWCNLKVISFFFSLVWKKILEKISMIFWNTTSYCFWHNCTFVDLSHAIRTHQKSYRCTLLHCSAPGTVQETRFWRHKQLIYDCGGKFMPTQQI